MRRIRSSILAAAILPLLGACGSSDTPTEAHVTSLQAVSPAGGAVNVDPRGVVTISFNHAIMVGMQQYAALHEGEVTGPAVSGAWALSVDAKALTFTPASPLKPKAKYTIHLGGGMMDAQGQRVDMKDGTMMGGQHATGTMMTGGGMMQGNAGMMGSGWAAASGNYGMVFSFTTA